MIEIKYGRKFLLEMMPKNSVCAEIGVSQGLFTEQILEVVQPKKLHLIDPWAREPHTDYYDAVCEKFKDHIESGQVQIHRDKSQFVYDQFPDQYFDWIYVDDVVNGLIELALAGPDDGTYVDIGTGQLTTTGAVAETICEISGTGVAPILGALRGLSHHATRHWTGASLRGSVRCPRTARVQ